MPNMPATRRRPAGPSYDRKPMHERFPSVPVSRHAPERFEPREVLRRTGFRIGDEARASRSDLGAVGDGLAKLGAGDFTGQAGNVLLLVLGGLLGLVMLDLLLSQRGSSVTSAAVKWFGSQLGRVVSPTDPLTSPGAGSAPTSTAVAGSAAPTSAGSTSAPAGGVAPRAPFAVPTTTPGGDTVTVVKPSGRIVPIPGSSYEVDSSYVGLVGEIEKLFGVTVTSGYRSPFDNANTPGAAPDSDHLTGRAADFGGPPAALQRLYNWASSVGFPYIESPQQAVAAGEGPHVHISFYRPTS